MYAILDIETTGGKYNEEGITEIAIYRFDGHEVTDQFISLVNPEKSIQPFVVKLTGIHEGMLRNAPKFYEVAKRIVEITEDCVLVAHNAQFDYRILKTEFRRLGFDFKRKSLCTVELAQKLMPEQPSYSLGKLVRSLGIPVSDRHRANGDALATLKLFQLLLQKDSEKSILSHSVKTAATGTLSPRLLDMIDKIPSELGVFYLYDEQGKLLYLGKHKNMKQRVNQLFVSLSATAIKIQKEVRAVTFERCGHPLLADLKEFEERRKAKPRYNQRSREIKEVAGLFWDTDDLGYLTLEVAKVSENSEPIVLFSSITEGLSYLKEQAVKHGLCLKKLGLSEARKACSLSLQGICKGACTGDESVASYNERTEVFIREISLHNGIYLILGKGRKLNESSAIIIENGKLKGYTYYDLNFQIATYDVLQTMLVPLQHSLVSMYLIYQYLRKDSSLRIKKLES